MKAVAFALCVLVSLVAEAANDGRVSPDVVAPATAPTTLNQKILFVYDGAPELRKTARASKAPSVGFQALATDRTPEKASNSTVSVSGSPGPWSYDAQGAGGTGGKAGFTGHRLEAAKSSSAPLVALLRLLANETDHSDEVEALWRGRRSHSRTRRLKAARR